MFAAKPIPAAPASQSRTDAGPYATSIANYARAAAGMIRRPTLAELRERARLATEMADEAERDLMEAEEEAERLDLIDSGDLDARGDPIAWPKYRSV